MTFELTDDYVYFCKNALHVFDGDEITSVEEFFCDFDSVTIAKKFVAQDGTSVINTPFVIHEQLEFLISQKPAKVVGELRYLYCLGWTWPIRYGQLARRRHSTTPNEWYELVETERDNHRIIRLEANLGLLGRHDMSVQSFQSSLLGRRSFQVPSKVKTVITYPDTSGQTVEYELSLHEIKKCESTRSGLSYSYDAPGAIRGYGPGTRESAGRGEMTFEDLRTGRDYLDRAARNANKRAAESNRQLRRARQQGLTIRFAFGIVAIVAFGAGMAYRTRIRRRARGKKS